MRVCVIQAVGLDRLALDGLYDTEVTAANDNGSRQMEPVANNYH